ncbi:MAG: molybdenum cofactor biosynthesis protein MoaE [Desulfuromonas sp.]
MHALIQEWKQGPDFVKHVGMVLSHHGLVRGTTRVGGAPVECVRVTPDNARIEALRCEFERRPGIYRIAAKACEGCLYPGDNLLYLVVAGDIREHVKPVLAELLDRIKAEAVQKEEVRKGTGEDTDEDMSEDTGEDTGEEVKGGE